MWIPSICISSHADKLIALLSAETTLQKNNEDQAINRANKSVFLHVCRSYAEQRLYDIQPAAHLIALKMSLAMAVWTSRKWKLLEPIPY